MTEDYYFIPKKIKVGYQHRSDTYTQKLAYIIYYDHKNVLRKETSWKTWCNKSIEPDDFDNIPTEGFVLNKTVGGYKSHWNYRSQHFRVYDPRGFEFEITPENLLWILDWCTCAPGKGLEGKFVYGWDRDQLYLIPCITECYTVCNEYSNRMYKGISNDSLEPGTVYRVKGGRDVIYIGNLKFAKQLGKRYSSKYVFVEHKYSNNIEYDTDKLIVLEKSSILHEVSDGPLTKEEINDIIYRFSICPFSYDFWHSKNIIDRFVNCDNEQGEIKIGNYHTDQDYDKKYNMMIGVIAEDGKSVVLNKPVIFWETSYYYATINAYKFINLTADMNVTEIADIGTYNNDSSYEWRRDKNFDESYKNPDKTPQLKLEYADKNHTSPVFYITKDNYIYDLGRALATGCISFLKHSIPSTVMLPVKYKL